MPKRTFLAMLLAGVACSPAATPSATPAAALTPEHSAAMRDSVQQFLDAFAADMSAPPVGKKAREALSRFYAPEIVMSTDLTPDDALLVQTLDSLVPAEEVVSMPPWIKGTRMAWGTTTIIPLAPGLATFTAKYSEQVTDTTGTLTILPGVQQGIVRHDASGWRFVTLQSSHPMAMHERQAQLVTRMTPAK
jgi:hypothetical protein